MPLGPLSFSLLLSLLLFLFSFCSARGFFASSSSLSMQPGGREWIEGSSSSTTSSSASKSSEMGMSYELALASAK